MSTNQDGATCPIRSDFADDPEMAELVEMFVDELGERVEAMSGALGASDWEKLTTLAHQLKGAGGGYGFPTISESAAKLEASLHERSMDDLEMLQSQVDELIGFCRRAAV